MAARYVDTANIVAQGQSFYTGLLPGSYEKAGGGGGGGNVMGRGSGGSAGVSADRTASEAAGFSIKDYKPGGSILPGVGGDSDADRIVKAIKKGPEGGLPTPDPTQVKDPDPDPGPTPDPDPVTGKPPRSPRTRSPEQQAARTEKEREATATSKWVADQGGPNALMRSSDAVDAMTQITASKGGSAPPLPELPGPKIGGVGKTDYIKESSMGQWDRFNGSVQRIASTRAHTRQSGVQQSATHQSFLYPNMANSTNRALNF